MKPQVPNEKNATTTKPQTTIAIVAATPPRMIRRSGKRQQQHDHDPYEEDRAGDGQHRLVLLPEGRVRAVAGVAALRWRADPVVVVVCHATGDTRSTSNSDCGTIL